MRVYYHHSDLDGKCSAAIIRRKYPKCELIGVDYPDQPNISEIKLGEKVFVVDFCFEPYTMFKLWEICGDNLVWIDHHKSSIEKMRKFRLPIRGLKGLIFIKAVDGKREIGKAACELTWEYLFPEEPMPKAVKLLGRYDVFNKSNKEVNWEDEILPFQYGMRLYDFMPKSASWEKLFDDADAADSEIDRVINRGNSIIRYESQRNNTYSKAMVFSVEFDGHKAWAINKALSNSFIFESIPDCGKRPLWILFSFKEGIWRYSLYSHKNIIDVSKIAIKYGGGGHAGAAGFQSNKYLLKDTKSANDNRKNMTYIKKFRKAIAAYLNISEDEVKAKIKEQSYEKL